MSQIMACVNVLKRRGRFENVVAPWLLEWIKYCARAAAQKYCLDRISQ